MAELEQALLKSNSLSLCYSFKKVTCNLTEKVMLLLLPLSLIFLIIII